MTTGREQVLQNLADAVLEDVDPRDRAEGERLVHSIVRRWGANPDDPAWQDVLRIARDDLLDRLAKAGDHPTLDTLRQIALEQRVGDLSSRSLSLAQRFARADARAEDAQQEASVIAGELDQLLAEVKALAEDSELRRRLTRNLADTDLEVRYVIDGGEGATSIRLAHLLED